MSALGLIEQARTFGAELVPMGGTLRVRTQRPLPDNLIAELRVHKAEVLAALQAREHVKQVQSRHPGAIPEIAEPDTEAERQAIAYCEQIARLREKGMHPPSYTTTALCRGCGLVWIFQGAPARVDACPWCSNRTKGLPIPRPSVSCATCQHFRPDPIGHGGIGSCARGGPPQGQMPAYPYAKRQCSDFESKEAYR